MVLEKYHGKQIREESWIWLKKEIIWPYWNKEKQNPVYLTEKYNLTMTSNYLQNTTKTYIQQTDTLQDLKARNWAKTVSGTE